MLLSAGRPSACCSACAGGQDSHASAVLPSPAAVKAAQLGDPQAMKIAGVGAMGDLLPTLVFPADVKAYKKKLDPSMVATNAAVEAHCPNLPSQQAVNWGAFFLDWRKFADAPVAIFSSWELQLEIAKRFERDLAEWQDIISESCTLSIPKVDPPGKPFPTATVLLVAGGAVVATALGYSFYKTAQQAGARANKGRRFLEDRVDRELEGRSKGASKALARSR